MWDFVKWKTVALHGGIHDTRAQWAQLWEWDARHLVKLAANREALDILITSVAPADSNAETFAPFSSLNRGPLQLMRGLSGKIREHCIYFGLRRGIYRNERRTGRATEVAQTVERILQAGDAVLRPKHLGGRHKLLR